MKSFLFALLFLSSSLVGLTQFLPPRKIQVAILFDASNSMDGLLNQAKSRIWNIVNELSTYRYNNERPVIQFALYQYGKDDLLKSENYIERLLNFTTDLDVVSSKLFGIRTHGGSEYCGAVIQEAHNQLDWSLRNDDLKMIYIAGNEPFNQGTISFREVIPKCLEQEIFVNTIYCGPYEIGVKDLWKEGADLGGGSYFNINADQKIQYIETPYDDKIAHYNDSLNSTYLGYGRYGIEKKNLQMSEDFNAAGISSANNVERSVAKSKSIYTNSSWDLLDGLENNSISLDSISEKDLPKEFQNLSKEEKEKKVEELRYKRETYQKQIKTLGMEREKYIQTEMEKKGESSEASDFGKSVNKSIAEKANKIGFTKESN